MIYVVTYNTESGDRGVAGYVTRKPTEKEIEAWFKKHHAQEWEDGHRYIYWEVHPIEREMAL